MSKEILDDLKLSTKFTEGEICQWYENFQKQCPTGRITPEEFEQIYARFFPDSDAKSYARHVFRSFDTNDDGTLDFKEYIIALHMTSTGKTTRKLEWAFSLFDVDKNGYINKTEVTEICQVTPEGRDSWRLPVGGIQHLLRLIWMPLFGNYYLQRKNRLAGFFFDCRELCLLHPSHF